MKLLTFFLVAVVVANDFCFGLPEHKIRSGRVRLPVKHKEAKPEVKKIPYQVGILLKDSDSELSWCGGSLIDHEWVLTAAHCTEDIEEATLYLGSSQRQAGEVTHEVKKNNLIIHPGWDSENIENDISLIRIPYTEYSENIQPAELPESSNVTYREVDVITSGWGHISDSSAGVSSTLDSSLMHVISNKRCREYFGWVIRDSNVCVTSFGLISMCKGDTGGPVVLDSTSIQIGVSSFGSRKGCERGIPSVLTKVAPYLNWIKSTIKKANE